MKTLSNLLLAFTILCGFQLLGCSGGTTETSTSTVSEIQEGQWFCPMKCEGDKAYAESGKCPKCKMSLAVKKVNSNSPKKIEKTESGHEGHDHEGHNHEGHGHSH